MFNHTELEFTIARAEREAAEAREKLAAYNALTDAQRVATLLHETQCHSEHTETCGWFYENWNGQGWTKNRYLEKAEKMLAGLDYKTIVEVLEAL